MVAIALFGQSLSAFPYRFTRLIKTDAAGKIAKTVDLIYDTHVKIPQLTKKVALDKKMAIKKGISPEEWPELAVVERSLEDSLRRLSEQPGEKIDLIWEWSEQHKAYVYMLSNLMVTDRSVFLLEGGKRFEEKFNANEGKRIKFVSGDTYRRDVPLSEILYLVHIVHKNLNGMILSNISGYLNETMKKADSDIQNNKSAIVNSGYELLQEYFKYVKDEISKFLSKYGLEGYPASSEKIDTWIQRIKEKGIAIRGKVLTYNDLYQDWFKISKIIMNLELLVRMLSSNASHIIVYAGGNHCEDVMDEFISYHEFIKIIDIGIVPAENFYITLAPSAWNYLQEAPADSLRKGNYIALMDEKYYQEIAQTIEEDNPGLLRVSIVKSIRCRADLVNAISVEEHRSLLHYAVLYDAQKCLALLLYYSALTNIKDLLGNTPIFYVKSVETAKELLKHGAKINIHNNSGETPLYHAVLMNEVETVSALLEAGADPNEVVLFQEAMLRPLDLAVLLEHNEIAELLKQHGATRMRDKPDVVTKHRIEEYIQDVKGLFEQ